MTVQRPVDLDNFTPLAQPSVIFGSGASHTTGGSVKCMFVYITVIIIVVNECKN